MAAGAKPDDPKVLAAYYNNLGQAEARTGQLDESVKSYDLAAQQNPPAPRSTTTTRERC